MALSHRPTSEAAEGQLAALAHARGPCLDGAQQEKAVGRISSMADIALEPGASAPATPRFAPVSASYGRYALTLLVMIYTVNFLDRQIITTVGEAIKVDLKLTDTQMGALGGIFFAFVYTVLGIPIARVADKANRPLVMTLSLAVWSGFTVLSAYAKTYG